MALTQGRRRRRRETRRRRRKVYFPRVNPMKRYDDTKFMARYRLSKEIVSELAAEFKASGLCSTSTPRGGGLSVAERVCLAIRYYATGSNYTLIGDHQGVHKSTVCQSVKQFSRFLYRNQGKYIHFPYTPQEQEEVSKYYYDHYGEIPNCLGCIDGTHIRIVGPSFNEASYMNRKNYYSINALVISDGRKLITHIDARWPGGTNDAFVFSDSIVHEMGEGNELGDYYFLGDAGYPLKSYLFTPISETRNDVEERFNIWQKQTRSTVECTIGILKQRWRCLDGSAGYLHHHPDMVAKIFAACVCLHNLARLKNMPPPPDPCNEDIDGQIFNLNRVNYQPEVIPPGRARSVHVRRRAAFMERYFSD